MQSSNHCIQYTLFWGLHTQTNKLSRHFRHCLETRRLWHMTSMSSFMSSDDDTDVKRHLLDIASEWCHHSEQPHACLCERAWPKYGIAPRFPCMIWQLDTPGRHSNTRPRGPMANIGFSSFSTSTSQQHSNPCDNCTPVYPLQLCTRTQHFETITSVTHSH